MVVVAAVVCLSTLNRRTQNSSRQNVMRTMRHTMQAGQRQTGEQRTNGCSGACHSGLLAAVCHRLPSRQEC